MNESEVISLIEHFEANIDNYIYLNERRINQLSNDISIQLKQLKKISEYQLSVQEIAIIPYLNYLYLQIEYKTLKLYFSINPGLMAILAAVWGVITFVYEFVVWIVDILHIKELLIVADILRIVWPAFRERMDKIYGKISEFSEKIGWGVDGLVHLIQAAQGGVNVLGGMLGKGDDWLEVFRGDRAITALRAFSGGLGLVETDPGRLLDIAFRAGTTATNTESLVWWKNTSEWIQTAADNAEKAIKQVNDTIDNLQELQNNMPAFIRDSLPPGLLEGLDWIDRQIDDMILPALTRIDRTFSEVEAVLESHRKKAANLVYELTRPGDLLLGVDKLIRIEKEHQERKIDDVVSREFERASDEYEREDADIISEFARIADAVSAVIEPPAFLSIEDMPLKTVVLPGAVEYKTWFIGDF